MSRVLSHVWFHIYPQDPAESRYLTGKHILLEGPPPAKDKSMHGKSCHANQTEVRDILLLREVTAWFLGVRAGFISLQRSAWSQTALTEPWAHLFQSLPATPLSPGLSSFLAAHWACDLEPERKVTNMGYCLLWFKSAWQYQKYKCLLHFRLVPFMYQVTSDCQTRFQSKVISGASERAQ